MLRVRPQRTLSRFCRRLSSASHSKAKPGWLIFYIQYVYVTDPSCQKANLLRSQTSHLHGQLTKQRTSSSRLSLGKFVCTSRPSLPDSSSDRGLQNGSAMLHNNLPSLLEDSRDLVSVTLLSPCRPRSARAEKATPSQLYIPNNDIYDVPPCSALL